MKRKIMILGMMTFFVIFLSTTNSNAGRCENTCVPKVGGTCSYGTGDPNDPIAFCTGWTNMIYLPT